MYRVQMMYGSEIGTRLASNVHVPVDTYYWTIIMCVCVSTNDDLYDVDIV